MTRTYATPDRSLLSSHIVHKRQTLRSEDQLKRADRIVSAIKIWKCAKTRASVHLKSEKRKDARTLAMEKEMYWSGVPEKKA